MITAPNNVGMKIKYQLGSQKNIIIGFEAAGGWEILRTCIPTVVRHRAIGNSQKLAPKVIKNAIPIQDAKKCPAIRFVA